MMLKTVSGIQTPICFSAFTPEAYPVNGFRFEADVFLQLDELPPKVHELHLPGYIYIYIYIYICVCVSVSACVHVSVHR